MASRNGKRAHAKRPARKKAKSHLPMPVLVPQPNGKGALLSGGVPGNSGGKPGRSGPRPGIVKALAAGKLPKHVETLDSIAKGEIVVTLVGKCAKCGHIGERTDEPVPVRASERVRAIEVLKEFADTADLVVTNENAGGFLECIDRALRELVEPYIIDQVHERSRELFKQSRKAV